MIGKLIIKIRKCDAPIVAGLDPNLSLIPEKILDNAFSGFGETPKGAAEAVWEFNRAIIEALADVIPAVKPQIAMYEQLGLDGLEVFRRTVNYCRKKELIVIGDVKRGDIGSTSEAYARAHLGSVEIGSSSFVPFGEDFATVNPWFGTDGIKPFTDVCAKEDKGIFVLVKTSNPSGGEFQDLLVDGRPVYEYVAEKVNEWGAALMEGDYSNVGCVVGATYPEVGERLRALMPHAFILVPGYGAQGAKGSDIKGYFNKDGLGAIVNSSRGIIGAWKSDRYASFGPKRFDEAARQACLDMKEDINSNK
ncbi:MAG: orotidine-5'-phosphate decarboxylase [Lachnospiraceae bacterium]|nr:orotidine-5'-phosphate decarboxylase [Lachnospiraceae bacterium]